MDARCADNATADNLRELLIALRREVDPVGSEQPIVRRRQGGELSCGVAQDRAFVVRGILSQTDVLLMKRNDIGQPAHVAFE